MANQPLSGFKFWMEASAASDAIIGVVSGGSNVTGAERSHLLSRRTSDFSSEIRSSLKNLGVVKSVVGRGRRIEVARSIDSGVSILDLIKMVERGDMNEGFEESYGAKKLIVMRGVSGSGKSTVAADIARQKGGVVLSTDDFFEKDGRYEFDPRKLPQNHAKNQSRAEESMKNGVSPIIIDNTNTQAWEMKPYVAAALENGYEVEIVEPGSEGFPEVDFEEIMRRQKNRQSGKSMPEEVVRRMMRKFQRGLTVQDILDSRSPYDP
jgi:predicted kinase